jgi:hypothetical protein
MSNVVFSRAGWRTLLPSWLILASCIVASVAIVLGSNWFRAREQAESVSYERRVRDARVKLDAVRRERDSLQQSVDVFRTLVERGLLQGERRLELVEMVNGLRTRFQLFALDYDVSPQRPLTLAGSRAFTSVEVLASRVKLRARALHEGDIVEFIETLAQSRQGFYPVDRCTLRRIASPSPDALQPHVEAECALEWITLKEKAGARPG